MEKNVARQIAKENVSKLSARERFSANAKIAEFVKDYIDKKGYKSAFIYMSVSGEVNTLQIITNLFNDGKRVYIPKVMGDVMFMTEIHNDTSFILNKYKIPEAPMCSTDIFDVDVNIIPCVAFDKSFNRVGHGKGYYDKYLKNVKSDIVLIAFSAQEVDEVLSTDTDIKPNVIITEKGLSFLK